MSVVKSRKSLVKSTKQQFIVDATINLITKIGIDNIRMEDIALVSNYTKRTLYAYFKSKDEIILWLFTDDLTRRWAYQKEQLLAVKSGWDKLTIWAISLYDYCEKNPHSLQLQNFVSYHNVQPDKVSESIFKRFKSINDELADGLRNIFQLGISDFSFKKDIELDITISQFLYSYRAIISRALSDSYSFAEFDRSTYINHYLKLISQGLKNS